MVHYYLLKFKKLNKVLGQATIAMYTAKVDKFLVKYHHTEDIWLTGSGFLKCKHCKKRHVTVSYLCMKIKEQAENNNSRL